MSDKLNARLTTVESATSSRLNVLEARLTCAETSIGSARLERHPWTDKYADNARLQIDLDAAHAEITRLGGNIPVPCGPLFWTETSTPVEIPYDDVAPAHQNPKG